MNKIFMLYFHNAYYYYYCDRFLIQVNNSEIWKDAKRVTSIMSTEN